MGEVVINGCVISSGAVLVFLVASYLFGLGVGCGCCGFGSMLVKLIRMLRKH